MSFARQLERKITGKINKISKKEITVQEANVNKMITRLAEMDEAAAEELQKKYITTVKSLNEEKEDK
jgi:hypothetical protein